MEEEEIFAEGFAYTIDDDFTLDVEEDIDQDAIFESYKDLDEKPKLVEKSPTRDVKGQDPPIINSVDTESIHKDLKTVLKCEPEDHSETNPSTTAPELCKKRWKCEFCGYITNAAKSLQSHVKMHSNPDGSKLYKCKHCAYETFNKAALSFHMARCESNHLKIKCRLCDFCTIKRKNLNKHFTNMHASPKPKTYRCLKCSFETKEVDKLHDHKRNQHMEKCHICEFKTDRKVSLQAHLKKHHSRVKTVRIYQCDVCDYESPYSANVIKHRVCHVQQCFDQ